MQEVKSRIRVQIIEPEGDDVYPTVRAFHVGDGDDKVPVRYVGQNAQGQYSVALEEGGPTIYWSPDETGNQVPHTTPSQDDGVSFDDIWVNPLSDAVNDSSTVLPMPAESDWQDRILVFPEGSGIEPLYLVFKTTARNEPGVVTGKGEDITGIWLEKAGQGLGAPIPSQIADKLRGREFSSFDVFRKAFWVEVSKDEFLMSQFNKQNQNRILLGKSPKTRSIDKVGKRNSFEIHHIEEIQYGGEVYNVDNLRIVTAKNHIRIHKNEI
ncbi:MULTISPECIES: S-type pyocin domain-containing protein [unclassified Photobacterium]